MYFIRYFIQLSFEAILIQFSWSTLVFLDAILFIYYSNKSTKLLEMILAIYLLLKVLNHAHMTFCHVGETCSRGTWLKYKLLRGRRSFFLFLPFRGEGATVIGRPEAGFIRHPHQPS